jgi:hypothetical protein
MMEDVQWITITYNIYWTDCKTALLFLWDNNGAKDVTVLFRYCH